MQALLPAAGYGTRLRPLTFATPKVLVPVAGKPMICHTIDTAIDIGINDITLVIGYLEDKVENYLEEEYEDENVEFTFVVQDELLGLGHAIKMGFQEIDLQEETLILLGDTVVDTDWEEVLNSDISKIGTYEVEDPTRFGVVETDGDTVSRLVEKPDDPPSNKIIAGSYFLKNPYKLDEALDELLEKGIKTKEEYQVTDALQLMIQKGIDIGIFDLHEWLDCGKPNTLLSTNKALLEKYAYPYSSRLEENNLIRPPVHIPKSTQLKNCIIGPYVSLGDNCSIKNSTLRDTITGDSVDLDGCFLEKSLLGNDLTLQKVRGKVRLGDTANILK